MAIPAMALLQQHDARWDILIEPAARRNAAIETRGHSELGAQSGLKTNRLVIFYIVVNSLNSSFTTDGRIVRPNVMLTLINGYVGFYPWHLLFK